MAAPSDPPIYNPSSPPDTGNPALERWLYDELQRIAAIIGYILRNP